MAHMRYVYAAMSVLFFEACLGIVWFILMLVMNLNNNNVYEQVLFDTFIHFAGAYLTMVLAYKIAKSKKKVKEMSFGFVGGFTFFFLLVGMFTTRNFLRAWYMIPNTGADKTDFYTMTIAITTTALILSGIEFLWCLTYFGQMYGIFGFRLSKNGKKLEIEIDLETGATKTMQMDSKIPTTGLRKK